MFRVVEDAAFDEGMPLGNVRKPAGAERQLVLEEPLPFLFKVVARIRSDEMAAALR